MGKRAWVAGCITCFAVGLALGGVLPDKKEETQKVASTDVAWECKELKPAVSKLKNQKECLLCGENSKSLIGYFRKFDDIGIISVNDWYVLGLKVRNYDEHGNLKGAPGGSDMGFVSTGEDGFRFRTNRNSDRGIVEVTVEYGKDHVLDEKFAKKHLCQECLDKLWKVMETYGEEGKLAEPKALCLVDFQTLELYSLQGQNVSYFVRDYYVQVDAGEEETGVQAVYAPVMVKEK